MSEELKNLSPDLEKELGQQLADEDRQKLFEDLTIWTPGELLSENLPEIFYPAEGFIPVGLTVLASAPKIGKSWMMLQMSIRIARGEDFLSFRTNKCGVAYFALEDSEQFAQDRLQKVVGNNPDLSDLPENFRIVLGTGVQKLNKGFLDQLDAFLKRYPDTKVVIIDTLKFIRPNAPKGVSPYDHDYQVGNSLKKFADAKGIALITVTHTVKARYTEDDLLNISGSVGVIGSADALIVISKERRTDRQATMFIDGRRIRQSMHQIAFSRDKFVWEYQCELSEDQRSDEERKRMDEYMNSPVRQAVIALASNNLKWKGTAGQMIEASARLGIGVGLSRKEVGRFLSGNIGLFMQIDRIYVETISHGTAPNQYKLTEWTDAGDADPDDKKAIT